VIAWSPALCFPLGDLTKHLKADFELFDNMKKQQEF
jgi:hypothetical protein